MCDRKVALLKDRTYTHNEKGKLGSSRSHQMHVSILFKCCSGANSFFLHNVL